MASTNLAIKFDDIEAVPLVGLDKECYFCDPENPTAVDRSKCQHCKGTGREALAVAEVSEQITDAKKTKSRISREALDELLY